MLVACGSKIVSQILGTLLPVGIKQIENIPPESKKISLKQPSCSIICAFKSFPKKTLHSYILTNRKAREQNYHFPSLMKG